MTNNYTTFSVSVNHLKCLLGILIMYFVILIKDSYLGNYKYLIVLI